MILASVIVQNLASLHTTIFLAKMPHLIVELLILLIVLFVAKILYLIMELLILLIAILIIITVMIYYWLQIMVPGGVINSLLANLLFMMLPSTTLMLVITALFMKMMLATIKFVRDAARA